MIGKLKGQIDSCFEDHVIIDVAGVGYLVYCTLKGLSQLVVGEFCTLFIETHVREDHINLYGFPVLQEKNCFNILQTVTGIGPRLALTILSNLNPSEVANAVAAKDKEAFRAVSGVGPKMAERMLVELKGKLISMFPFSANAAAPRVNDSEVANDAISALTNLGINRADAQSSISAILNENPEISINELIKEALKIRARK
jgi:holliday junction DNA helicase RuvA